MRSDAGRTAMVVNNEYWSEDIDFTLRKNEMTPGGKDVCKDCGEVLDCWPSLPRTCHCCKATVCALHSGHAEIHATRGQAGGGLFTFCTYCLDTLRVSERTKLAERNKHQNATIPPTVNLFAAVSDVASPPTRLASGGGISTPSSSSPPSSASSSSSPSPSSLARPVSYLGHRKCHESSWRDCSSLLGATRRNRLPPGQPSATRITRTADGELPLYVRGAAPAAVDIRATWCSHWRTVSWGVSTVNLFEYTERERTGGDLAWINATQSVRCSGWKGRAGLAPKLDRDGDGKDNACSTKSSSSQPGNPFSDAGSSTAGEGEGSSGYLASFSKMACSTKSSSSQPGNPFSDAGSSTAGEGEGSSGYLASFSKMACSTKSSSSQPRNPFSDAGSSTAGEGEGSSGYLASFSKMAGGALAVVGVAATIGVMALSRRR